MGHVKMDITQKAVFCDVILTLFTIFDAVRETDRKELLPSQVGQRCLQILSTGVCFSSTQQYI
jgi:hypothetical protein